MERESAAPGRAAPGRVALRPPMLLGGFAAAHSREDGFRVLTLRHSFDHDRRSAPPLTPPTSMAWILILSYLRHPSPPSEL